jgi:hypothetical protein
MNTEEEFIEFRDKLLKALEESYRRVVKYKREINSEMIIVRDGKVVAVNAHEMPDTITCKVPSDKVEEK